MVWFYLFKFTIKRYQINHSLVYWWGQIMGLSVLSKASVTIYYDSCQINLNFIDKIDDVT